VHFQLRRSYCALQSQRTHAYRVDRQRSDSVASLTKTRNGRQRYRVDVQADVTSYVRASVKRVKLSGKDTVWHAQQKGAVRLGYSEEIKS
jgi:hypothetical protein